jgi:hypothetical protein
VARRPSSFPRVQSDAVARVLASDLAEDERVVVESLRAMRKETAELAAGIDEDARTGSEKSATPAMRVSREAAIALVESVLAVGAMAVDHLIGESDPGESDSFPVDTTSFVLTSLLSIALVAGLVRFVVRRAR